MLRYISLLLFIGLVWTQDITIAVLDFEGKGVPGTDAGNLTDRLRDEIFKTGSYVVLERGKMDEVLSEQGFQQSGVCESSECAVEVGRLLGVQQMVAGSIGKVGTVYTVSARIFDVETGEIINSANYDHIGDIGQLLVKGMRKVVSQLVNRISSETQIITNNSLKPKIIKEEEPQKSTITKGTFSKKTVQKENKISKIIGLSFSLAFLIGVIQVLIG